jgi:hypothetical protein
MKKLLILIIIVLVVVLVWWMLAADKADAPTDTTEQSASIDAELQGLTDADLDAEFKEIDEDSARL